MGISFSRSVVVLSGAASVMACGDEAGRVALERSSWDVILQITVTERQAPSKPPVVCPSLSFTMHLDPHAAGLGVTWGASGLVIADGQMVRRPGGAYVLAAPTGLPTNEGCAIHGPVMTQLALHGRDSDGDGVSDKISGHGEGKGTQQIEDVNYDLAFSFELAGSPDVTPPRLTAPDVFHPLDRLSVLASEPLASASAVRLEGTSSLFLAASTAVDGAIGAFTNEVILPFSGAWTLTGVASDLIGLPLSQDLALKTLADPGVLVDGGFEGDVPLVAAVIGHVAVVSAIGTVPALGGGHSLLVPPEASATLHLIRPPGASSVRFKYRTATKSPGVYVGSGLIRIGVVGGRTWGYAVATMAGVPPETTTTGDPDWPFVTPLVEVTEPLVDDGDDIVLQISRFGCAPGSLCPRTPAVLIDDVRVE